MSPGSKRATVKKTTAISLLAIAMDEQYLKCVGTDASLAEFKDLVKVEFDKLLDGPTSGHLDEM